MRAVRPGQIDVLEDAALGRGVGEARRAHAVGVDRQQFARLDLADERGADDVERGGLGGHHPAAVQPAERPAAARRGGRGRVQRVLVHEDQAERAAQRRQQLQRRLLQGGVGGAVGQQRAQDVGVRGRRGAAQRLPISPASRARAASSAVLTRLPLCPNAIPVPAAVVRNTGWAFSQVVEPVVE